MFRALNVMSGVSAVGSAGLAAISYFHTPTYNTTDASFDYWRASAVASGNIVETVREVPNILNIDMINPLHILNSSVTAATCSLAAAGLAVMFLRAARGVAAAEAKRQHNERLARIYRSHADTRATRHGANRWLGPRGGNTPGF